MKKLLSVIFISIMLILVSSPLSADLGPEPSSTIRINLNPSEEYYVALYSSVEEGEAPVMDEATMDFVDRVFVPYEIEGYYYTGIYEEFLGSTSRTFTNSAEKFKIVVYKISEQKFLETKDLERYAFESTFRISFDKDQGLITTTEPIALDNYTNLILRIAITVVIELIVAACFGLLKKYTFLDLVLVNIVTQLALNAALYTKYQYGGLAGIKLIIFYAIIEPLIILVEGIYYFIRFKKYKEIRNNFLIYALFSNLISFLFGTILWLFF